MASPRRRAHLRPLLIATALTALAGCDQFDFDLRNTGTGIDTTDAARRTIAPRPEPDDRGVISYSSYQVAVAKRGDTVAEVATRVGLPTAELARYNGIPLDVTLRDGEILALPTRVAEPSGATGAITTGPIQPAGVDISTLAGGAIDRAGNPTITAANTAPTGTEPVRHKVERGETAYSIARLYSVSPRSLAEWNSLDANLSVREGQYLLIPVATGPAPILEETTTAPGAGSPTPVPPSAAAALPAEKTTPAAAPTPVATPPSPDLQKEKTSSAKLQFPASGKIIRGYEKKKNDGIDIAAAAGSSVKAADAGVVAAITRDTDQVPILVLRHDDNLLTVYANIADIKVAKGDSVTRGQTIATVRTGDTAFLHFEVRKGFESVDPMPYLE